MLNKIKIIGKILLDKEDESEKKSGASVAKEMVNEFDKTSPSVESDKENKEVRRYFSLLVPTPSGSLTILRCVAQGENAERIAKEVKEDEEVIEVRGYLRNEKDGRQILIRVVEFNKIGVMFDEIDKKKSNQVRLIGKIITDLSLRENNSNTEVISFKLLVPKKGKEYVPYFCRTHGELIPEITGKLKKGDIILLEGFLQTKKIVDNEEIEREGKIKRISSIICQAFVLLDNESVNNYYSLDKLELVSKEVEEIDFTKPKEKTSPTA